MIKFFKSFSVMFLVMLVVSGCIKNKDSNSDLDSEQTIWVGIDTLEYVPGHEVEDLFYHTTSKTVYVIGESGRYSYCSIYRDKGSFWKYDESQGKLVPEEAFNLFLSREDMKEILNASKKSDIDVYDIILQYIETKTINEQQKTELINMLENTEYEIDERQKSELIDKILNM